MKLKWMVFAITFFVAAANGQDTDRRGSLERLSTNQYGPIGSLGSEPSSTYDQFKLEKLFEWESAFIQRGGEAGSGTGTSSFDYNNYPTYQNDISAVLRIMRDAELASTNMASPEDKRGELKNGLEEALRLSPDVSFIVINALQRGLWIEQQFQGGCSNSPVRRGLTYNSCLDKENRAAAHAMAVYYRYVINNVIPLEFDYLIPYYERNGDVICTPRGGCQVRYTGPSDDAFFESFYDDYRASAEALVKFYIGEAPESGLPHALASNIYEIRVAAIVLSGVATDLELDIFSRAWQCVTEDARWYSQKLIDFLHGDRRFFRNSERATIAARHSASEVRGALSQRWPCNQRNPWIR